MNRLRKLRKEKGFTFDLNDLADNQVYVKLLNGFELRTKEGVITGRNITRKQCILFFVLLLWQNGRTITADALVRQIWNGEEMSPERNRQLRNLGYSLNKDLASGGT